MNYRDQQLAGWGRYPASRAAVARPDRVADVVDTLHQLRGNPRGVIARGSGLAYGDAALNAAGQVLAMGRLDRFLAFDAASGLLSCEAGVTLGDILDICIPRGWLLPVTPGTARATAGGCLACDVHGKNHHLVGSFAAHVTRASVLTGNGEVLSCGPGLREDLFQATAGGMGLTGIILDLTLQLQRIETAYVVARNIVAPNLETTFSLIESTRDATYSVAWLDGASRGVRRGRGIVMLAEPATCAELGPAQRAAPLAAPARRSRSLPFDLPFGVLTGTLARAFNEAIYRRYAAAAGKPALTGVREYFYPLDALDNWNRLYGPRGFLEYQAVLPAARAFDAIRQMLGLLEQARQPSFFTSIKMLGAESGGLLSFPSSGLAFSFDVPAGDSILPLLDRCDEITAAASGRVYLAKDARLRSDLFDAMYPRRREWVEIARRHGAATVFASDMSRRLGLTP